MKSRRTEMKKLILPVVLAAFCLTGNLFAQQSSSRYQESEYYYFNFPIEKIYAYRLGYVILYRKGTNQMARTHVPSEWLSTIGGKGEVIFLGTGTEWPSMSVYYKNGEFSHVRLRLRRSRAHETWGVVPLHMNIDEFFQDVEEIQLEF